MPSTPVTLQSSMGKRQKTNGFEFSHADRRQLDDDTSDDKLFQVLAAATGNARWLIVESHQRPRVKEMCTRHRLQY